MKHSLTKVSDARSRNMSAIRGKNTKPEMHVRSLVHGMGYRFRLHAKDLPGKPDLVFRSRQKVIFVHGCFWHQHDKKSCADSRTPKTNTPYWVEKFSKNIERDRLSQAALRAMKWKALVIWDCEIRDRERLARILTRFLDAP